MTFPIVTLADLFVTLGTIVFILTLLEIFFSEAQKKLLADATTRVWDWLDEARKLSFTDWLRHPVAVNIVPAVISGLLALVTLVNLFFFIEIDSKLEIGFELVTGFLFGYAAMLRLLRTQSPTRLFVFSTLTLLLLLAPVALGLRGTYAHFVYIPNPIVFHLISAISAIAGSFLLVLTCFWLLLFVPLFLANVTATFLTVAEFLVRRIAEYPKGPILAVSSIVGGLAAIVKTFAQ